jgi:flavodoxin
MNNNIEERLPISSNVNNILVAYFSYSGNTRFAAEQIQGIIGDNVDIFEIKPVKGYPTDYNACVAQAKKECADGFKPELVEKVRGINQYDVIFVGTPNWCHTIAPPILSFLSSHDLSGKTVIPFVTHGGGGMARCETDIQKACPKSKFGKGGVFFGGSIKNFKAALAKWVNEVVALRK